MIKRYGINKFVIATFSLILICIISVLPSNELDVDVNIKESSKLNSVIYLLDKDNYVSKLSIFIDSNTIEDIIKEKLFILRDGSEEYINFKTLIPKDTIINNVIVKEDNVYIDFSKEFLSVGEKLSESMLEAIIYSITEINGINNIYIYIDGSIFEKFPNSNNTYSQPFTRNIGINKKYDLINLEDVHKTTVYFVKNDNDINYYVPVTKINNDSNEKISIIIDELKSTVYSTDDLESYLSNKLILNSFNKTEDTFNLVFNDYIFESIGSKNILEEVKYTIGESVIENYGVKEVIFSTLDNNTIDVYTQN